MVNIYSSSLFVCYWSTQLGQGNGTSLTPKGWPSCPSTFISKRWLLNHANLSWSVVMGKRKTIKTSFFSSRFHHASVPLHLGILSITTLHQDFCDSRNMPSGRRNSDSFIPSWDCFQSGQGLVDIFWLGDVGRSILRNDISTNGKWWFGLVVWIPGIPENETDCYLGVPRFESQTTGPQTTNLSLVEIFKLIKHYCICLRLSLKDFGNNILRSAVTYPLVVGKISVLLQSVGCVRVYIYKIYGENTILKISNANS